jgi:hypothetical protein
MLLYFFTKTKMNTIKNIIYFLLGASVAFIFMIATTITKAEMTSTYKVDSVLTAEEIDYMLLAMEQTSKADEVMSYKMQMADAKMFYLQGHITFNEYEATVMDYTNACWRLTGSYSNGLCQMYTRNWASNIWF